MDLQEDLGYLRAKVDQHESMLHDIDRKVDCLLKEMSERKGAVRMLMVVCSIVGAAISWLLAIATTRWPKVS